MAQHAFCSCRFSSHICLSASVAVLQPTILARARCLKSRVFCLDPGSDLCGIVCQFWLTRMVLCCFLLLPYPNTHPAFSLLSCLSPTVFWALISLSPTICSFCLQFFFFYYLKGTLPATHICPSIILCGLFYSCARTVADVDHCLAMLNRSAHAHHR